jgi:hypothetical protein
MRIQELEYNLRDVQNEKSKLIEEVYILEKEKSILKKTKNHLMWFNIDKSFRDELEKLPVFDAVYVGIV